MAQLAPVLMAAGTVFSVAGQIQGARAAREAGQRRKVANEFEAQQLEQQSGQVIAAAQRQSLEEQRQSTLMQSRALALAAASGAGASDPTVTNLIAKTSSLGAYKSAVALYQGEEKARQLRVAASARRMEGDIMAAGGEQEAAARNIGAFGTALQGGGSLYGKYGGGGSPSGESRILFGDGANSQYG